MPDISLIEVPRPLRRGLVRRLPRGTQFKDLTGTKFGLCRVLGFAGYKGAFAAWLCRCHCGNQFVREGAYVARPRGQTCGCCWRKNPIDPYIRQWRVSIISHCSDPRDKAYATYGKRGIKVCQRWLSSAEKLANDMGPRPSPKHFLIRRDTEGNFTPSNCFWGTAGDRSPNRKREITHNGKTQHLAAWAKELGISRQAMHHRVDECLRRGIDVAIALTTPVRKRLPKA